MKYGIAAALAVTLMAALPAQAAGDAKVGAGKAYTCLGCHGIPNYNNASPNYRVPRIGGQSAEYIEAALKAYRSGERNHPTMHNQAMGLSDADIADIAAYFVAQKTGTYGKPLALPAKPKQVAVCSTCHGEDGVSKGATFASLGGQYSNYIEHALKAYQTGERKNAVMSAQAKDLSKKDIEQLAAWYANQKPVVFTLERPAQPAK